MIEMTLPYAAELLGEYLGNSWDAHRASMLLGRYDACFLAMEWQTRQAIDPLHFYAESALYLLELLHWNSSDAFKAHQQELVRLTGLKVFDFGAGIGTISHQLAQQDNYVTFCDINWRCFCFAEWWGRKLGVAVRYERDLGFTAGLERDGPNLASSVAFDAVVAVDVIEHLASPGRWLSDMARILKVGGALYAKPSWGFRHVYPMHYDHRDVWLNALEQAGFEPKPSGWTKRLR